MAFPVWPAPATDPDRYRSGPVIRIFGTFQGPSADAGGPLSSSCRERQLGVPDRLDDDAPICHAPRVNQPPLRSLALASMLFVALVAGALIGARKQGRDTMPSLPHVTRGQDWHTPERVSSATDHITLEPGFRLELVAAEPLIEAPVWITFDEHGRIWVVEMVGYMRDAEGGGETEPSGRIAILEDTDGDGVMDRRSTFADELVMPRAVLPCYGGALVIEPPNLLFMRDTDGDGRADRRDLVLSGFEGQNPEHAPNALTWGLDNWIHLSQHSLEFRFDARDPSQTITRPTPAHGQWGMAMDQVGRLFYTPNSEALRMDLVPKHYASRHPSHRSFPFMNTLVCEDQTVWPIHPTPGVNRGYMDGILREDKRLAVHTAACGPALYHASLFPPEFRGNAFIAEPAGNLVRRLRIEPRGDRVRATGAYPDRDFLASTNERFRPVQCAIGPEGALYIVDMHRGVIQHKTYLTDYLKEQVIARGLERPLDMGRIYRIVPDRAVVPATPRLGSLTNARLVDQLSHPDMWRRTTAQRLLIERQASEEAIALRRLARQHRDPITRLHALWTLDGLAAARPGVISPEDALAAMADADDDVVIAGLRIAERWLAEVGSASEPTSMLFEHVLALASGKSSRVRTQALLTLGASADERASRALVDAALSDPDNGSLRAIVISGLYGRAPTAIDRLLTSETESLAGGRLTLLRELFDAELQAPDFAVRAGAIELLASLASDADPATQQSRHAAAAYLLGRLQTVMRLGTEQPRPIELASPPKAWIKLVSTDLALSPAARDADQWLVWPGHGSVVTASGRVLSPLEIARFDAGRALFTTTCAGCHGVGGTGAPGHAPALAGSSRVRADPDVLVHILLHGLEGPLESDGQRFNSSMPAAPFKSDEEMAAVLTYIRRAWGNNAEPVGPEPFARARASTANRTRPYRIEELEDKR